MEIPDLVSDLEADLDPSEDLIFILFVTNDNLAVGSLISEAESKGNVSPVQAVSDSLMEPIPTIDFIILEDEQGSCCRQGLTGSSSSCCGRDNIIALFACSSSKQCSSTLTQRR